MNYSQYYIPHGYKELTIPATADGAVRLVDCPRIADTSNNFPTKRPIPAETQLSAHLAPQHLHADCAAQSRAWIGGLLAEHCVPNRFPLPPPQQDKTFTATLFMPFDKFDCTKTPQEIVAFFEAEFPDFVPLLGQ
jgi:hypothetical protein